MKETEFHFDIGGIPVSVTVSHKLLNASDPDVSFAYMYCGSIGDHQSAADAAARGRSKALWADTPDVSSAQLLAQLAPLAPALPIVMPSGPPFALKYRGDGFIIPHRLKRGAGWCLDIAATSGGVWCEFSHGILSKREVLRGEVSLDSVNAWRKSMVRRAKEAQAKLHDVLTESGFTLESFNEEDDYE